MALLAVIVLFVVRCCSTLSAEGRLNIKKVKYFDWSMSLTDNMPLYSLWECGFENCCAWTVVRLYTINML